MSENNEVLCPVCACDLNEGQVIVCPACDTPHHADCWEYNEGCAIYGCDGGSKSQKRLPVEAHIDSLVLASDPRFVFTADNILSPFSPLSTRLAVLLTIFIIAAGCGLLTNSLPTGFFLYIGLYLLTARLIKQRAWFDLADREFVHCWFVGHIPVYSSSIPFRDIVSVVVKPSAGQMGGWIFNDMLRLRLHLGNRERRGFMLDMKPLLSGEDISRWATALGNESGLQVVRAPEPHRHVLLKRLRAFSSYLFSTNGIEEGFRIFWSSLWLLVPAVFTLAELSVDVSNWRIVGTVNFFTMLLTYLVVTFCFSITSPDVFLSFLVERRAINTELRPWNVHTARRNFQTVDNVLSLAEEKRFTSPLNQHLAIMFYFIACLLLLALVPSRSTRVIVFVALALAGGEITKATRDEKWTRQWIKKALSSIEHSPPKEALEFLEKANTLEGVFPEIRHFEKHKEIKILGKKTSRPGDE